MSAKRVGIVNYGVGNLRSVADALTHIGVEPVVLNFPKDLDEVDGVILPGVGAFGHAMETLERDGMIEPLRELRRQGERPILGICLGMQLLFERSEESADIHGLGLLEGSVAKLAVGGLKLPHVGWNSVRFASGHPVLAALPAESEFYFDHSYSARCADALVLARAEYGGAFPAIVGQDRVLGVQFHPERSQAGGLAFLRAFVGSLC